ncbi:MAG: protein phosphatase 2C domain-containing protein, partial [Chloroflexota bacterium]
PEAGADQSPWAGAAPPEGEGASDAPPPNTSVAAATSVAAPASPDGRRIQVGDLLLGRYRITKQTATLPEYNEYRAQDLAHCGACGWEQNRPGDEYCAKCGALLAEPRYVTIVENVRHIPERYDLHQVEGEREYFLTYDPEAGRADAERGAGPLHLAWGHATDPGQQRDRNEDSVDIRVYTRLRGGALGLFVVADGLGGQDSGEVASRMTVDALWARLREVVWEPNLQGATPSDDEIEEALRAAVRHVNQVVYEQRTARGSEMSSTLTAALIVEGTAYVANVGDSRTYLWSAAGLRCLTKDHSLVQRLVDNGQIEPQAVYAHPQRHLIYQSMGDRPEVQPDTLRLALTPDDRLILCSDGLWEMVRTEGLEEALLAEPDPQRACAILLRNANLAGGEDNISVIIVHARA